MPVPNPESDEDKDSYLDRCMADEKMVEEYDQDQRFAICQSQWESKAESDFKNYLDGTLTFEELFNSLQ